MKPFMFATGSAIALCSGIFMLKNRKEHEEGKKQLLAILEEIKMEYIPIYVHSYNMFVNSMRELKSKQDMEQFIKSQIQEQIDEKTAKADEEIWVKHGITVEKLAELLEKYKDEPEVQDIHGLIEENTEKVFAGVRPDFKLEYPDKITSELYFEILTAIFEVVRYETYWRLRYRIRNNHGKLLPKEEVKKVLKSIEIEGIRRRVIEHYDITIDSTKTVEEVLKNVYYSQLTEEGFDEQASEIYKYHEEMLIKILAGEIMSKLEIDPLTGEKRDYSIDEHIQNLEEKLKKDEGYF